MRIIQAVFTLTLVSVASVSVASPAWAQDAEETARERFATGSQLVEEGRFEEAYEAFAEGYEASPRPLFLFNMAQAAREAGLRSTAVRDYRRYLEADPEGEMADNARRWLSELAPEEEPAQAEPEPEPEALPPVQAEPGPAQGPLSSPEPAPEADDGGSLFTSWPFWVGVAAVLVAGGVTAAVLLSGGDDSPQCEGMCALVDFRM